MKDIKKTMQEAQNILSILKTRADKRFVWKDNKEKKDIEMRINHLMNVDEPACNDNILEVGLLDLRDNIDNQIQNKDEAILRLSQRVEEQKNTINQLTNLTAKLESIKQGLGKAGNVTELGNLKTSIQSFTDKFKSEYDQVNKTIQTQTEELKSENKRLQQDLLKTKNITYITGATGGMSFLGLIYLILKDTFKEWANRKLVEGTDKFQKIIKGKIDKI